MRNFNPGQYKKLFEGWSDPVIQAHMTDEEKVIKSIENTSKKTFIDLGAGYGRILPIITKIAWNSILIDLNKEMFQELTIRAKRYQNAKAIKDDITNLSEIIKKLDVKNAVLLLLQNTLGTIEGDWQDVLFEMKKVMDQYQGEVIISLYRKKALPGWGLMTYYHGQEMNGEPDLEKTDFNKGLFVSKTGYTSIWWSDKQIHMIKKFFTGKVLNEISANEYWIFHIRAV